MRLLKNEKIVDIMENALNYVDTRLVDHGKRVAYLMFKVLEPQHRFDERQLRDICFLAMLHDVGAYKTEEIDKMVIFETTNVWEHSIYGYLFLKHFSPLKNLADVILYHHADCEEVTQISAPHQLLAQLISLCDRADVFLAHNGNSKEFRDHLEKHRDKKYRSDVIKMFLDAEINIDTVYENINSDVMFTHIFREIPLSDEDVEGYINMLVYSIDFRSSQTVIHTVSSVCISAMLAKYLGMNEDCIEKIRMGAALHDIGKIGIPVEILESPNRLNDAEMKVMRTHVNITEKIIASSVESDILKIAINHHEKLNGTGYPQQIGADHICLSDRIVAVADIFSALCGVRNYKEAYSKERVVVILEDMGSQNLIDTNVVSVAVEHYEEIIAEIEKVSVPVVQAYEEINREYARLLRELK